MTSADLRALVAYNYWARDRVLDAVGALTPDQYARPMGNSFSSIRDTLVHLYSAESIWYSRWQGESPARALSPEAWPDLASLVTAWRELEHKVRSLVDDLGDAGVDRVIEYRLLNGQPGRSAFAHMVQHVVNHGSYHRGQVTTMLRQLGAPPPKSVDLITYYREQQS